MSDVIWANKIEEVAASAAGLKDFEDFWRVESGDLDIQEKRRHHDRRSGRVDRRTVKVVINGFEYFLKRCSGAAYGNIGRELAAGEILPKIGLRAPKLAAYSLDESSRRGFILLKKLAGFHSLQDLHRCKPPPQVVAAFQSNKREFLIKLFDAFFAAKRQGYFYPDWRDKHIFFNVATMEIALIDLERLRHVSDCPAAYRLALVRAWKRHKEFTTLRRALGADFYSRKTIMEIYRQGRGGP